jgi:sulfate transport system ATP-binding protein
MSFVGEVNRLGDALIRPHDLDLSLSPTEGSEEGVVERVSHLGFEVRVELTLANGEHAWAQVTREESDRLDLTAGQTVYARPSRARRFEGVAASGNGTAPTDELQIA